MFKGFKKIIALALLITPVLYNMGPVAYVLAQEETPTPEATSTETTETTTEVTQEIQTTEPTPTSIPDDTQTTDTTETTTVDVSPTLIPSPTPTPIPWWSDEYDAWQEEQERLDDEAEIRENEWEANEEDEVWVAEHGGSESYYVSGQWQKDQDAAAAAAAAEAAEAALAAETTSPEVGLTAVDPLIQTTPTTSGACDSSGGLVNDPSLALAGGEIGATSLEGTDSSLTNGNCASLSNDSYTGAISGENTQSGNDGPVAMNTGGATGEGTMVNQANTNITDSGDDLTTAESSSDSSFASGTEAENLTTGEDSENFATAGEVNSLGVENSNEAYVENTMSVDAVSGSNLVEGNDGDVVLTSGDIELIANMLNILNLNITGDDFLHLIVNIFGTLNGTLDLDDIAVYLGFEDDDDLEIIARNENTGEGSENNATAYGEENTDIDNTNTAVVNNEMNVSGVSGENTVGCNDGNADVVTGRIKILANLMNFINSNFSGEKWSFIMVNIFGALNGDIIVPGTDSYLEGSGGSALAQNTNPGEGSESDASAVSTDTLSVTNTNDVVLTNNINAAGVSGNNQQAGNDDDYEHTVQAGEVDVVTQLMNFINFNITGNNWVFLIVNVFGKWMGQIVGFADTGTIDAPGSGSFAALAVGGSGTDSTQASNNATGEGSVNNALASDTNSTDVNNQNSAVVNNTMNIEGVSGANAVNRNDGATSITTGWVEIDANLLNIINMNVTGRSWLVVFLNVFGDFVGDLFFGQPPSPAAVYVPSVQTSQQASDNSSNSGSGGSSQSGSSSQQTETSSAPTSINSSVAGRSGLSYYADESNEEMEEIVRYYASAQEEIGDNAITQQISYWQMLKIRVMGVRIWFANIFSGLIRALGLKI